MTPSNAQLVRSAKDYAARSDGLRRRAWLCISVALGTTSSVPGAAKALDAIDLRDVRAAAHQLLAELADRKARTADRGPETTPAAS